MLQPAIDRSARQDSPTQDSPTQDPLTQEPPTKDMIWIPGGLAATGPEAMN